jgi:hypothetical protein
MVLFLTLLNISYRIIVIFILVIAVWNVITLEDFKRQVMTTMVIIPLLLRAFNII